ncbi:MAG TPA: hypothetical protein ENK76_00385, partial [Campylobacterales bacterium]|nr:hypothetical protein [Campylobacterales bacterium]
MKYRLSKIIFFVLLVHQFLYADALLLNEYNGVTSSNQLANNGYDTYFGDVDGNGGNWIELVVTEDYLDLRNAKITMTKYAYGKIFFTASFPNLTELAYLRKGTIITISDEPTDLSYSPMDSNNPDWTININHSDLQNQIGTFNVASVNSLGVSIKSIDNKILMNSIGEIITGGISSYEVFKLKKEPKSNIEPTDPAYGDDNGKQIISTFGEPNQWIDENNTIVYQNFSNLRDINSSINAQLLLNEYDGVTDTEKLKLDGNDTYFGKVYDNGGSWVELVVLKDRTDLRNSEIRVYGKYSSVNWKAKFPNSEIFSQLRSGTIITISDTVNTDLSYDPFNQANPDWTINLKSSDLTLIEGNFVTDNNKIIVEINSASGGVNILPKSGEGISGNVVDNKEVYKLKKDPYLDITPYDSTYGDDNQHKALSTFGTPNHWEYNGNLITQNFIHLRLIAMKHNFQEKDTSLILNEYNAVSSNQYLKDGGSDTHFGTIAGNGGSWLEMIVAKDFINLQNTTLKIYKDNNLTFSGQIPELLTLAFLRKGTIITISNEPTNMSYSPFVQNTDGWKLNINAYELTDVVGTFSIDDNNIKISIVDSSGKEILANSGEGVWNSVVDNQEVYKLKAEPTIDTTPFDNYGDDSDTEAISTFAGANKWKDINGTLHTQKLTIQKDKDLNETDGIETVNIDGLNISDGESLQYVAPNNSLWITDDDSHHLFELDLSTKEVKTVFDDRDFGTFASDIEDYCHDGIGICDIESIAYDDNNDTLYVFSGDAHSTSAIFKLTRNSTDENFTISDYRKFGAN